MSQTLRDAYAGLRTLPTFLERVHHFRMIKETIWLSSWNDMKISDGLVSLLEFATDDSWDDAFVFDKVRPIWS